MQKLKNSVLDRMLSADLTSNEIDFLIYVSRFQDDSGRVSGVHYKALCNTMHMSYQGFYDVKKSLQEKGFIRAEKSNRIDHDITIIGNAYDDMEYIKEGYVNTNHHIFFDEAYFNLKGGAKLLAMDLLRMSYAGSGEWHIGTKKFYEKYKDIFGVTNRVLRTYLMSLKPFFSIGIVDGQYYIRPMKHVYKQREQASENDNYAVHNINVICRRNKIKSPDEQDIKDVVTLTRQYRKDALKAEIGIFEAIKMAIEKSLEVLNESYASIKKRVLKPKLVHSILKEELA